MPKYLVSIMNMKAPTVTLPSRETEQSFMGPIWKITLMTMLGTAAIGFAMHLVDLSNRHKANLEQIALVEFRTKQYAAYRDIYKTEGKAAADASLTTK